MRNALLITAAQFEPVSLQQLKTQVQLADDYREHDNELQALITAAREKYESDTGLVLCSSSWRLNFDQWPVNYLELPTRTVSSVSSIKYIDATGTQQTVTSSVYELDAAYPSPRIRLKDDQQWPTIRGHEGDIEVNYVAGYANQGAVPYRDQQAILLLAANWFENRTGMIASNVNESPVGYNAMVLNRMRATYP